MASKTVWRTGIGVGLFVLTMLSASAAEPFIEISTAGIEVDGMQRQHHRGVEVDWVRRVHLNPAALQAQDISVDLYDMTLLLIRDTRDPSAGSAGEWLYETDERGSPKREMREPAGSVWTGTVHQREGAAAAAGVHAARVEIWESARGFSAEFRFGKLRYELIGDVLIKRDMRRFRVNENNDVRDIRPDRPRPPRATNADGELDDDAEHVIRVVYGLGARAAADGVDPLLRQIRQAINDADQGFTTSNVKLTLKTAANALPGYSETSIDQAMDDIAAGRDGPLWLLHIARERERADVMVMVIDTNSESPVCGSAQQILATRETAFLAVERRCLSEHTFAHEMGHLLGADHNTENVTLDPPKFDYGHGYRAGMHIAPRWRTVMAQECQDTVCDRENLWSSPLIHHNGQPAGTVGVHDNARVLRETKAIIAAFYPDPLQ